MLVIVLTILAATHVARADFMEGLAAYDAGDYYAAYLAWLPLAKAGDGDAQASIADLYRSRLLGEPVGANATRRNDNTAAWWYSQAARCGHAVAQLNLGDFHARGIGVEPDPVRAYLWLGLAGRQGRAWAEDRQREVAAGMTREQIVEGQRLIADWRPDIACSGGPVMDAAPR